MDIIGQIRQMPPEQQLNLAEQIWDGLLASGDLLQKWHIEEVRRRAKELDENPEAGLTHQEMWQRVEELRHARKP